MKRTLGILATLLVVGSAAAQDEVTIGVSIPAATHGWTGGVNFWAEEAKARLEATYPNLSFVVAAAGSAQEQASDLEDLVTVDQIDALGGGAETTADACGEIA